MRIDEVRGIVARALGTRVDVSWRTHSDIEIDLGWCICVVQDARGSSSEDIANTAIDALRPDIGAWVHLSDR